MRFLRCILPIWGCLASLWAWAESAPTGRVGRAWEDPRNPIVAIFGGQRLDLWSLRPVRDRTASPAVADPAGSIGAPSPLDAWLWSGASGSKSAPLPQADPRTLIRRLSLDLTGLPPTPEEIDSFVKDADPAAFEKLIDSGVEILDPATGTGTFVCELLEHFRGQRTKLAHKYKEEIHANEVAILPYYVANLNIESTYAAIAVSVTMLLGLLVLFIVPAMSLQGYVLMGGVVGLVVSGVLFILDASSLRYVDWSTLAAAVFVVPATLSAPIGSP